MLGSIQICILMLMLNIANIFGNTLSEQDTITLVTIHGIVTDSSQKPVQSTLIKFRNIEVQNAKSQYVFTDSLGRYTVAATKLGKYIVFLEHDDFLNRIEVINVQQDSLEHNFILLSSNQYKWQSKSWVGDSNVILNHNPILNIDDSTYVGKKDVHSLNGITLEWDVMMLPVNRRLYNTFENALSIPLNTKSSIYSLCLLKLGYTNNNFGIGVSMSANLASEESRRNILKSSQNSGIDVYYFQGWAVHFSYRYPVIRTLCVTTGARIGLDNPDIFIYKNAQSKYLSLPDEINDVSNRYITIDGKNTTVSFELGLEYYFIPATKKQGMPWKIGVAVTNSFGYSSWSYQNIPVKDITNNAFSGMGFTIRFGYCFGIFNFND